MAARDGSTVRRRVLSYAVVAVVVGLLTAGCAGGDDAASSTTAPDNDSTVTQESADDRVASEPSAPVVWDERSPMTLGWQPEGDPEIWRGLFPPAVVPHGEMLATVVTEPELSDAGEPVYLVVLSSDGVEWQQLGDALPPGNPLVPAPNQLLSSGDRLAVRTGDVAKLLLDQPDGSWQVALPGQPVYGLAAGPAGMLAFGLRSDGGPAAWRMQGVGFEPIVPPGIEEIDPATLQGVQVLGMPQGYLLRLLERGRVTDDPLPTWVSVDGVEWSPTEGPGPSSSIGGSASVGGTTIVDTRDKLWITHDGSSWKPLELDNQPRGRFKLDGKEFDVQPSEFQVWGGPNGFIVKYDYFMGDDRLFASPDGVRWLELTAPPTSQDLPPDFDFIDLGPLQVFNTEDSLVIREFVGGGPIIAGQEVAPVTIRTLTAPAIEWL